MQAPIQIASGCLLAHTFHHGVAEPETFSDGAISPDNADHAAARGIVGSTRTNWHPFAPLLEQIVNAVCGGKIPRGAMPVRMLVARLRARFRHR